MGMPAAAKSQLGTGEAALVGCPGVTVTVPGVTEGIWVAVLISVGVDVSVTDGVWYAWVTFRTGAASELAHGNLQPPNPKIVNIPTMRYIIFEGLFISNNLGLLTRSGSYHFVQLNTTYIPPYFAVSS
jgi:hypothetical protein